jgi:hypothetical protein
VERYGLWLRALDRPHHRALCKLIRSRFPPDLLSALRYEGLEAAPALAAADKYIQFKQALLQVAVQLDIGTSPFLEYIQNQTQVARTVIQHITALRSLADLIPLVGSRRAKY